MPLTRLRVPVSDRTSSLLDLVFPIRCPVCEQRFGAPCSDCGDALRPAPLLPAPAGIGHAVAACRYDEVARHVVLACKRQREHALTGFMATRIVESLLLRPVSMLVSWVPTTPDRVRERGFDHAELLAQRVARRLGLPCRSTLRRVSGARDHAGTGGGSDTRGGSPSFTCAGRVPEAVLLVDDVRTTGATLSGAAEALRAAGAVRIDAATFAATPGPSSGAPR